MTTTAQAQATAEQTKGLELTGISKVLGGRTIIDDLDLAVEPGELVCLLGPSGCGKTTTLRTIGGFIRADAGSVLIDGQDVGHLPPERRPTAMVFQNYALWPHMTVFDNIGFGLKLRKLGRVEIRRRVAETLELVGLTHHVKSHPAQISGGEQQRVALARALVLEPKVLLLDEPLSNLDAKLRVRVREDIREIQQRLSITTVFVTHDQDEALSVADRIAVMNDGRIEQYAGPDELYRLPRTRFVAEFVGTMNFFDGSAAADTVTLAADGVTVPCAAVSGTGEDVTVAVRPEDVRLAADGPGVDVDVVREVPRGHYKEVLASFGANTARAFVPSDFAATSAKLTFTRALVYRDDRLLSPSSHDHEDSVSS